MHETSAHPAAGAPENVQTCTSNLLEDFWHDYLSFQRDALSAHRRGDAAGARRHLRAALFGLVSYLTGLANRWPGGADEAPAAEALPARLLGLARRLGGPEPPAGDLQALASLASRCASLRPDDEAGLAADLSLEEVAEAGQSVAAWLDAFCLATGLPSHAGPGPLASSLARSRGEAAGDPYGAFDALAGDPDAFQDDPAIWEPPPGAAGRS